MNIDLGNQLKQNLGLEDNSQVEVNFHIDTDEDANPDVDGEAVHEPLEVSETPSADTDVEEVSADTDIAADDAEELEEAQNSLESLSVVLSKHTENGTMSRMGLKTYQLALESIVPARILEELGVTSMESHLSTSKYHAGVMAQVQLDELAGRLATVSTEARGDWLKKVKHNIAVFFKRERALEKRARALLALADGSEHEKASNDNITVNGGSKSPVMTNITTLNWENEKQFKGHVDHFCALYNSMSNLKRGYDDEFTDNIFPESRSWPKDENGNPCYKTFRIKLVRKDGLVIGHKTGEVTTKQSLPNLTPAMCNDILNTLIETLVKGGVIDANLDLMTDVCEKVMKTKTTLVASPEGTLKNDVEEEYPEGYVEMHDTLIELRRLRIKVTSDILNYVNYSLTDREYV